MKKNLFKEVFFTTPSGSVAVNIHGLVRAYLRHKNVIRCGELYYQYEPQTGVWERKSTMEIKDGIARFCNSIRDDSWTKAIREYVLEEISVRVDIVKEMDVEKKKICMKNGVLDLFTGKLEPFSPDFLFTCGLDYDYKPNMKTPTFNRFIRQVCCQKQERIDAICELMGYVLTCDICAEKIAFMKGDGQNGKSTLIRLMENLVGEKHTCSVTLKGLESDFSRVQLLNKKMMTISELSKNDTKLLFEGVCKAIVSGDSIDANIKHGPVLTFVPHVKIVIASNHEISFANDSTYGAIRRIAVFPFEFPVSDEKKDVNLGESLRNELPGIIEIARKGYVRFVNQGYHFSNKSESDEILKQILLQENPIKEFVKEKIRKCYENKVKNSELRDAYSAWSQENGVVGVVPRAEKIAKEIANSYNIEDFKGGNARGIKHIKIL